MSGQSLFTLLTEFSETYSPVDFMLAAKTEAALESEKKVKAAEAAPEAAAE